MDRPVMDSHEISALLFDILEMVGLSNYDRFKQRKHVLISDIITTVIDTLLTNKTVDRYSFGSNSEGTFVSGMDSDFDFLNCNSDCTIFLPGADKKQVSHRVVLDPKTNPGYAKIQLIYRDIPLTSEVVTITNRALLLNNDGKWCLSNRLDNGVGVCEDVRHGPAFRNYGINGECDNVEALKWTNFPDTLKQWLTPDRQHTWRDDVLERCRVLPLLLVPVGHPFSEEEDIEWRISYSFHKRELMFSLNPSQHKCYVILKMMKKEIIYPKVGEDCISSYHLKTCLFWAIEHTQNTLWTRNCLLECVSRCLWYLMYFVLTGNCPNYFLPEVNLFQRLNFSQVQSCLLSKLKTVITELIYFIKLLKCADVGMCIADQNKQGIKSTEKKLFILGGYFQPTAALFRWNRTIQQVCYMCESREDMIERLNVMREKLCCLNLVGEHTESLTREAIAIMDHRIQFTRDVCIAANAVSAKENFDGHLTHLNELATVSGQDLLSPRLMIVTLLYKLERYVECENVLMQIDKDLSAYVLSCCACKEQRNHCYSINERLSLATSPDAMAMLASATATCISFVPADLDLVPEPLLEEMDRCINRQRNSEKVISKLSPCQDDCLRVDGKVYFYLMKYLVYSHLNKPTERCLNDMRTLIDTDLNLRHRYESKNVYDWMNDNEY